MTSRVTLLLLVLQKYSFYSTLLFFLFIYSRFKLAQRLNNVSRHHFLYKYRHFDYGYYQRSINKVYDITQHQPIAASLYM